MKSIPATVPDELVRHVRTVGTGEAFWPISIASRVAQAYAHAGLAITGGEIYVAQGRAWGNMEVEWATDLSLPRNPVAAGLAHALEVLERTERRFGVAGDGDAEDLGVRGEPMCFFAVRMCPPG